MVRYLQASEGVIAFGVEGAAYSKATSVDQYFGLIREDVEPPNPNPQTPMSTAGERRGPHLNSPDPKELSFDVPFQPLDEKPPYEVALGTRTTSQVDPDGNAGSGDEYQKDVITEANRLPTMTVGHWQSDGSSDVLESYYIGTKASLEMSASQGEPLSVTMSLMSAELDATTPSNGTPGAAPTLNVPQQTPYRFWMLGDIDMSLSSDGSAVKTLGSVHSFDLSWDNGLESNNHGNGRDAYSISESTAEEKYDHSLGVTIEDMELYERAYNDGEPVDIEILLNKNPASGAARSDLRDAMYLRLNGATINSGPSPLPGEGKIEADIGVSPRNTEIEIHTPA
jgi:hypothetical protein